MRGARPRRLPKVAARRMASGLTLLEMLVVFVLVSLVGTLLIQGAGFFLGQYDNVKRIGREASSEALQQRWFASTVHGMVPYLSPERNLAGDSATFQGITMQPLGGPSGIPVAARWSILSGDQGTAVVYTEQPSTCASDIQGADATATQAAGSDGRDSLSGDAARGLGDIACGAAATRFGGTRWTVLESVGPLAFQYAGMDRVWRDRWPVEGRREWIPRQVRLVASDGQTLWNATFGLFQEPVGNPRDFR